MPDLTQDEIALTKHYIRPCSLERILDHLDRLAMHKRMDGNDHNRTAYLLADYAKRLYGITEVEIMTVCEKFIEKDTRAFFPQYAEILEALKKEFRNCKWSKYYVKRNQISDILEKL